MLRSLILSLVLFCCGMSVLEPAAARPSSSVLRKAKRKFAQAEVHYRLGAFEKALSLYKQALKLARRPSIVFNIAQCYRFLEKSKKAIFFYELYLSEFKRTYPGKTPPNEEEVAGHLAKLREQAARKAHGLLELEGLPAGASVLIDGMIVAKAPLRSPLKLAPGQREIRVEAPGYLPTRRAVEIVASETLRETLTLVATRQPRSTPWLVSGISAAALAVGAEVAALVFTRKTNDAFTDTDAFTRNRNLAITGHIVAGSLAIFSGVSFYLWYRSGKVRSVNPAATAVMPALGAVPLPGGGALITGGGRF